MLLSAGHCLETSFHPSNNTVVTMEIDTVNVTFRCVIVTDTGNQVTTQWNIWNFQGVAGGRDIRKVLPDTIYEGTPDGTVFDTFRNILKFPRFIEDFDGAFLSCGSPAASSGLVSAWFPLRVYRKSGLYYETCACLVLVLACACIASFLAS